MLASRLELESWPLVQIRGLNLEIVPDGWWVNGERNESWIESGSEIRCDSFRTRSHCVSRGDAERLFGDADVQDHIEQELYDNILKITTPKI